MPVLVRSRDAVVDLGDGLAWIGTSLAVLVGELDAGEPLWWQAESGPPTGTVDATEGADTLAAAGTTTVVGAAAVTDTADTLVAAGAPIVVGTLAVTDTADTLVAAGAPIVVGTLAVTDTADTLVAAGSLGTPIGSIAATEGADTLAAVGIVAAIGTLAVTEGADTLTATGTVVGAALPNPITVAYREATEQPHRLVWRDNR